MATDPASSSSTSNKTSQKRRRKAKNQAAAAAAAAQPEDLSFLDSSINSLFEMSPLMAGSLLISGISIAASLILQKHLWDKAQPESKPAVTAGGPGSGNQRTTPGGLSGSAEMGNRGGLVGPDGRVSTQTLSSAFGMAVQSQNSPQGPRVMQQLYDDLVDLDPQQCNEQGRMIAANFLYWYYRVENGKEARGMIKKVQSQHISSWLGFDETLCDVDQFHQKFDLQFSLAFARKSIPHLRRLFAAMNDHSRKEQALSMADEDLKLVERSLPSGGSGGRGGPYGSGASGRGDSAKQIAQDSNKDRFAAAMFQAACLLGEWDSVLQLGELVKKMENDSRIRARPISTWKSRMFETPTVCPDYGYMHDLITELRKDEQLGSILDSCQQAPPVFEEWNILSWKFTNVDPSVSEEENREFVLYGDRFLAEPSNPSASSPSASASKASGSQSSAPDLVRQDTSMMLTPRDLANMPDELIEGCPSTMQFFPSHTKQTATVPTSMKIWGRMMQFMTPATASNNTALLPVVATFVDSKIIGMYEREVTLRNQKSGLVRTYKKSVRIELDRYPEKQSVKVSTVIPLSKGGMDLFAGEDHLETKEHTEEGYVWEGNMTVRNEPVQGTSMQALWGMFMGGAGTAADQTQDLGPTVTQTYFCRLVIDKNPKSS